MSVVLVELFLVLSLFYGGYPNLPCYCIWPTNLVGKSVALRLTK